MSDDRQGDGWWLASDGKWYPPDALQSCDWYLDRNNEWSPVGGWRRPYDYAGLAAGVGWAILGFFFMWVGFNSDAGDTCATSGAGGYQACVREEELFIVIPSLLALGFGLAAVVISIRAIRERGVTQVLAAALLVSIVLVGASLLAALFGDSVPQPERQLAYMPVSNSSIGIAAAISVVIGAVLGLLPPVRSRRDMRRNLGD